MRIHIAYSCALKERGWRNLSMKNGRAKKKNSEHEEGSDDCVVSE